MNKAGGVSVPFGCLQPRDGAGSVPWVRFQGWPGLALLALRCLASSRTARHCVLVVLMCHKDLQQLEEVGK